MADSKDNTMKLFGKTFSLRRSEEASSNDEQSASVSVVDSEAGESCSHDRKVLVSSSDKTMGCGALGDESLDEENKENSRKDPNSDCNNKESSSKSEVSEDSPDNNKALKKPEKIVPCPRCNSMETKFCYFNNYNVNQPRHFCKNCQRYWTAGGTMRNVPVGAGRRKNKHSSSSATANNHHYRHLIIPENPAGILTFGSSETPLLDCDNQSSSNSSDHHQAPASFPGPPPVAPWQYWAPQPGAQFCHSGYPISFYPAAPWAWTPQPQPGILGKRSRVEGEVLMPKTLRIDDPAEAAKSSIWATLGIGHEKSGMFEPFRSKSKFMGKGGDDNSRVVEMSPAMQANPAAMSRSLRFLESA